MSQLLVLTLYILSYYISQYYLPVLRIYFQIIYSLKPIYDGRNISVFSFWPRTCHWARKSVKIPSSHLCVSLDSLRCLNCTFRLPLRREQSMKLSWRFVCQDWNCYIKLNWTFIIHIKFYYNRFIKLNLCSIFQCRICSELITCLNEM